MEVLRFDFNGSSSDFERTAQGFLRVNARLTKTGIFTYENGREYRSDEEVFHVDSLASLKGAPVTDLHPSERGADSFLTPANAKNHIIGITENVERDLNFSRSVRKELRSSFDVVFRLVVHEEHEASNMGYF